jgi:hypothetical protein
LIDQDTTAAAVLAVLGASWAGIERFRSWKASNRATEATELASEAERQRSIHAEVINAKQSVIDTITADRDGLKRRYDEEHAEYIAYRNDSHERVQSINVAMLELTKDNADLRAKTDLTPLAKFAESQQQTNDKMVRALDAILERLNIPQPHRD